MVLPRPGSRGRCVRLAAPLFLACAHGSPSRERAGRVIVRDSGPPLHRLPGWVDAPHRVDDGAGALPYTTDGRNSSHVLVHRRRHGFKDMLDRACLFKHALVDIPPACRTVRSQSVPPPGAPSYTRSHDDPAVRAVRSRHPPRL
ncbi:hypothetical protein NAEX_00595 [Nannocystis exedens]|nr:hypothetical protein NAEX_00595 [Nannocystis exedens]